MFDNTVSMFRRVAMGTAAENLKLNSSSLLVNAHEKLGYSDGEAVDRVDAMEYSQGNQQGNETSGVAFISGNHYAEWLPTGNRKTAPNIRRGERVEIYQFGSNEKYYWRCAGLDEHLRRLETVVFGINSNPDEGSDGGSPDNMYFVEWSSHKKMITLSTSMNNGEFCKYDFQFDMATGRAVLQDNEGGSVMLDTRNKLIRLINSLGAFVELDKNDINAFAPGDASVIAEKNIDMRANKITLNGGGSVFTLQGSGTSLKTPKFEGSS